VTPVVLYVAESNARQMDRAMRADVRRSGKRPREAYSEMVASVPKKFKDSASQAEILKVMPSYSEVQSQLSRHRQHQCTPVPDPLNIPEALRTTLRGRELLEDDPNFKEQFLLYSGQGGRLLVFCAQTELQVLRQSQYIVCDGTFEMCPDSAYQLYTLHGFCEGEAAPLVWALLPNKTQGTYEEFFNSIHDAMVTNVGDTGGVHTFLVDFELAAINALKVTFPDAMLKGCAFHFRQAILRRVQQEGLRTQYEEREDSAVRKWVKRLMSLCMLPTFAIGYAWEWLQQPPATGNASADAKLSEVAAYFGRTWINGDFPVSLWSHYDHVGPRTTNHAEGFHSSLNSRFGVPHPCLRTFLNWLQKLQFEVQARMIQLQAGRAPKPRRQCYIDNDNRMWAAKQ